MLTINESSSIETSICIYRYKFSPDFVNDLYEFSKIHQYDSRGDFKEAWTNWVQENDETVHEEMNRLTSLGYRGDILGKMFTSARYYFRKKPVLHKTSINTTPRHTYTGASKTLLESMDQYIKKSHFQKPSLSLLDYCRVNQEIMKEEIGNLMKKGIVEKHEIQHKIKKTYKNRYFQKINESRIKQI